MERREFRNEPALDPEDDPPLLLPSLGDPAKCFLTLEYFDFSLIFLRPNLRKAVRVRIMASTCILSASCRISVRGESCSCVPFAASVPELSFSSLHDASESDALAQPVALEAVSSRNVRSWLARPPASLANLG